jgi:hypothetical protein
VHRLLQLQWTDLNPIIKKPTKMLCLVHLTTITSKNIQSGTIASKSRRQTSAIFQFIRRINTKFKLLSLYNSRHPRRHKRQALWTIHFRSKHSPNTVLSFTIPEKDSNLDNTSYMDANFKIIKQSSHLPPDLPQKRIGIPGHQVSISENRAK